jgi:hypothetical protein
MIDCLNAQSAGTGDALNTTYGTSGTCWTTSAATAQTCTDYCKAYLAGVGASAPAACK